MDLADELLNDFGVDDEILEKDPNEINNNNFTSSSSSSIENNNASSTSSSSATTTTTTMTAVNTTPNPIKDANSFLQSPLFSKEKNLIHQYSNIDKKLLVEDDMPIQSSPLYQKIVQANNIVQGIDEEFYKVYQYIVDNYSKKVQDLQNIVPNPYDYIQTVLRLGHDVSVEGKNIDEILPAQQMMTLSVALTGAISNALSMDEMNSILDGCKICLTFINFRKEAVNCIELFMEQLAPNVTMLVGTEIAANLVALAGGMIPLSRVPACNVLLIGKKQKNLSGFSKINEIQHVGIIGQHILIQTTPKKYRQKAAKIFAGKLTLACRVDCSRGSRNGDMGKKLLSDVERKIDSWQQMNKSKMHRPLPIPGEQKSKKRGGKRYRKHKEKYGLTDTHRERKRIKFAGNDDEYGDSAMGLTNGTLGVASNGRLRLQHGGGGGGRK